MAFLWWTSTRRPRIGRKEEEEAARRRREAEERARSIRVGRSEGGGRVLRVYVFVLLLLLFWNMPFLAWVWGLVEG